MDKLIIESKDRNIELNIKGNRIAFITGAGVSVGSGLPTYYGKNGTYTKMKRRPEDVLSAFNMEYHPERIWNEISGLFLQGYNAPASLTHKKIADIESMANESLVLTQNVDMLHEKGGAKNIIHIHGSMEHSICRNCKPTNGGVLKTVNIFHSLEKDKTPECPICLTRNVIPDIVPFDGMFNEDNYYGMLNYFAKPIDICFVLGTQLQFPHIIGLLYDVRNRNPNAIIVDVNPDLKHINHYADYIFNETCDQFFNRLIFK